MERNILQSLIRRTATDISYTELEVQAIKVKARLLPKVEVNYNEISRRKAKIRKLATIQRTLKEELRMQINSNRQDNAAWLKLQTQHDLDKWGANDASHPVGHTTPVYLNGSVING